MAEVAEVARGASWGARALGIVPLTEPRSPDPEWGDEAEYETEARYDADEHDDELSLDLSSPLERPGAGV